MQDLRLAWVWAMNEGGWSEPAPLVHNGIIYLANTSNILQALDGRTGELIWENRIGPQATQPTRGLAIYQDKIFMATSDARLVALDARTGKIVWETVIADKNKGYANSSGPLVIHGKVIQGLGGCDRYKEDGCFISAYDAATGKQLWKFHTVAREGQPGGDTWGKLPNLLRAGGDTWITGSYDPELDLTYWGVAQPKPWMPASRGDDASPTKRSTRARRWRFDPMMESSQWYFQHAPGESLDLDEVFERVLVDVDGQNLVFTIGKPGILVEARSEDRQVSRSQGNGLSERLRSHRSQTGEPHYRPDIIEQETRQWVQGCPSTEGGHNWQAMSYHPADKPAHHSAQPKLPGDIRARGRFQGRLRRHRGRSALLRDARHQRQHRQARGLRRPDDEGDVVDRAAGAVPDGRALDGGGIAFVGDLDRNFRAVDVKTGKTLWQTRLGTSVQGFPITFSVDGKQYIAVPTGIGGGSPRNVPSIIAPEIHHPANGNALYVFALPDKK